MANNDEANAGAHWGHFSPSGPNPVPGSAHGETPFPASPAQSGDNFYSSGAGPSLVQQSERPADGMTGSAEVKR